jgi:hypothetical protein
VDAVIIRSHGSATAFQQTRRRQSFDIVVDAAVVALELRG